MRITRSPFLLNIPAELLLAICGLTVISYSAIGTIDWSATCLGLAFFALASCYTVCNSLHQSIGRSKIQYFTGLTATALGLALFVSFSSQPAHSQLLIQTADAICNAFASASDGLTAAASTTGTAAAKATVKSTMWILRALIIFFVLFSVFQMIQNRDDREKIQEIAKSPIMIVFGTIVVDVISSFVAASATATGGCG
jgi:beta-lactamase regulating signal transducer with metallopeptidase domain